MVEEVGWVSVVVGEVDGEVEAWEVHQVVVEEVALVGGVVMVTCAEWVVVAMVVGA